MEFETCVVFFLLPEVEQSVPFPVQQRGTSASLELFKKRKEPEQEEEEEERDNRAL